MTGHTPRSRIIELDIDPHHHMNNVTLPTPLPPPVLVQEKRSIVLKYSTSLMAQQFCLIEKSVLLDINWEELVDCKWTKMAASSFYQPHGLHHAHSTSTLGEDTVHHLAVGQPGMFSRKKRWRQQQEKSNDTAERGVEKAINRFNAVCQWVSSEIVQTKSLEERAKLIEKFIRLAKVLKVVGVICKMTNLEIRNVKCIATFQH